jgi:hypothetical protein
MNQYMNYRKWSLAKLGRILPDTPLHFQDIADESINLDDPNLQRSKLVNVLTALPHVDSKQDIDDYPGHINLPRVNVSYRDDTAHNLFKRGLEHTLSNLRYLVPQGAQHPLPSIVANLEAEPEEDGISATHFHANGANDVQHILSASPSRIHEQLANYAGLLLSNLFHRKIINAPVPVTMDILEDEGLSTQHFKLPEDSVYHQLATGQEGDAFPPTPEIQERERFGRVLGHRMKQLFSAYLAKGFKGGKYGFKNNRNGFYEYLRSPGVATNRHLDPTIQYLVAGDHLPVRRTKHETTEN